MTELIQLGVNPVPAARPRVSRWGTYYPAKYTNFKKEAREAVQAAWGKAPLSGPLQVVASFVVQQPKKTKLSFPKPDIDNYTKALLDACNGVVWEDDCDIIVMTASKAWAKPGQPGRIAFTVSPLD